MTDEKREFLMRLKEKYILFKPNICKECGGECCKTQGCIVMPWDIDPFTKENIWQLLDKGYYSIRAFFETGKAYAYLEAREVNHGAFEVLSPHSSCSQLGEDGCKFSCQDRPSGGISLIPGAHCENALDIDEIDGSWKDPKVVEVMTEVLKRYLMNHSLEKVCVSLFRGFEYSIMNDTCSYNFYTKYAIYHEGMRFGYQFEEGVWDKIHI